MLTATSETQTMTAEEEETRGYRKPLRLPGDNSGAFLMELPRKYPSTSIQCLSHCVSESRALGRTLTGPEQQLVDAFTLRVVRLTEHRNGRELTTVVDNFMVAGDFLESVSLMGELMSGWLGSNPTNRSETPFACGIKEGVDFTSHGKKKM